MLSMRIARSPLTEAEYSAILAEYNRLTGGRIPLQEFIRWVAESPEGPAWHAILETDEGRIVGHTSVFPIRAGSNGSRKVTAKSEYSFMHEDFRKEKISGCEKTGRPPFITLLDTLFQHCHANGWGPIFASTNEKNQVFTRKVGLRPMELPVCECLLVLRPWAAAAETPNLSRMQRIALFVAGLLHGALAPFATWLLSRGHQVESAEVKEELPDGDASRLNFFNDPESLEWRYIRGQYAKLRLRAEPGSYVIVKRGSNDRYVRVCQWQLLSESAFAPLFAALVELARNDKALGVRWAVYEDGESSARLIARMRRLGLLCANRSRIVMVHKNHEQYLDPALWRMNDSLFSFDP